MNFDEEPEGDPHGECAEEIHKLRAEMEEYRLGLKVCKVALGETAKERDVALLQVDDLRGVLQEIGMKDQGTPFNSEDALLILRVLNRTAPKHITNDSCKHEGGCKYDGQKWACINCGEAP